MGNRRSARFLIDELVAEIDTVEQDDRAAVRIHNFVNRETMRIAYGEFVRGLTPDKVGRQLAHVADAAVEASLRFALRQLSNERGTPKLASGQEPQVTVIGLGNLGGEELGYGDPLRLVFLFDRIDYLNKSHRDYYASLVTRVISLLTHDEPGGFAHSVDSRDSPMFETGTLICSVRDAARIYESSGQTWQRLNFVKGRTVAGDFELGERFLDQLQPWIYRHYMSREGLSAFSAVREKLLRRTSQQQLADADSELETDEAIDIIRDPGGRHDIELTIQFVQLLHGGDLHDVRVKNTVDAMIALERSGCLTHQEASLLLENYGRLCRLQHQLSVMFDVAGGRLPSQPDSCQRLAYQLGIRSADGSEGNLTKFQQMLGNTLQVNRKIISHLLLDTPESDGHVPLVTALVLDPDPDPPLVERTLSSQGLANPQHAMDDLRSLSRETVSFLSPQRCRQFFSALAPSLLQEIATTPDPNRTLSSLVSVTDSLGGKATLWELLRVNRPTMQLMVRLCAAAPYLSRILTNHPGMIDELIDSLLMDRLPRQVKIEAQSIELCRGAEDPLLILQQPQEQYAFDDRCTRHIGKRNA